MSIRLPIRTTAASLLLVMAALLLATCQNDGEPAPGATVTATATPTAAPPREGSPTASGKERPPEPPALVGDVIGWFTDPRPASIVAVRPLGTPPPSPFKPYDRQGAQVVLYDAQTMTERALGLGGYARFSPDGTRLAWVTGREASQWDELRVMDLRDGQVRTMGRARGILRWLDDGTLHVFEQANDRVLVDVATGVRRPATGVDPNQPVDFSEVAGGYRLEQATQGEATGSFRSTYRVRNVAAGTSFTFDAFRAVLAPDGVVFLATVSEPATRVTPATGPFVGTQSSNIFALDPATRRATFVATADLGFPSTPFAASADYVVWQERVCTDPVTRLYDRRAGMLATVQGRLDWPSKFTPSGALTAGYFGAKTLIDPATLEYLVVLPEGFSDVNWTPDYRYAVVSAQLGHGGRCG